MMIKRDIQPQWQNIANWYWQHYYQDAATQNFTIWEMLESEHGLTRTRSMGQPGWSVVGFPDEQCYTHFLLRWA